MIKPDGTFNFSEAEKILEKRMIENHVENPLDGFQRASVFFAMKECAEKYHRYMLENNHIIHK